MEKALFKNPYGTIVKLEIWEGIDAWYASPEGEMEYPVAEGRDRRALGLDLIRQGYERIS